MNTLHATRCVLEPQVEAHAAAMFEVMLSSTKKISGLWRIPANSVKMSPDGRRVWLWLNTVCTAQKSHLKWQPRPASTRPIGR